MDDRASVEKLLGRPPRGTFEVVVRDDHGEPVVLRNSPLLDDGTPMPTRYYLVGRDLVRAVSRLESAGGVREAERSIDPTVVAATHRRYAAERDAAIPADHTGPRPSGGVGGTRTGVKCLHAHVAHELATGDDPVGRWALERLDDLTPADEPAHGSHDHLDGDAATGPGSDRAPATLEVHIGDRMLALAMGPTASSAVPVGPLTLLDEYLGESDPPSPTALSNALGMVHDHLDDILIDEPEMRSPTHVTALGTHPVALARVEVGAAQLPADYRLSRIDADEVFRTLVGETAAERAHNPGLDGAHVHTIIPTCCVVLGVMRKLGLREIGIDVVSDASHADESGAESPTVRDRSGH